MDLTGEVVIDVGPPPVVLGSIARVLNASTEELSDVDTCLGRAGDEITA